MFLGTHTLRMDEKGRLALPSRFRSDLPSGVVLTRGQERCLYAFSPAEFQEMWAQMREAPVTSKNVRDYTRVFLSGASEQPLDSQGRMNIPQVLRSYAGLSLKGDCGVIGVGQRVEIWNWVAWSEYISTAETSFAEIVGEGSGPIGPDWNSL